MSPGKRLRERLQQGTLVLPGVFNAITALIAQRVGFEALYLSGAGVTNGMLGMPDIALITLTEMVQQARYVTNAVNLPVLADADTGYGEFLNVMRTVQEFEQAGLAGMHIEDQLSPKRCGHLDGKQLLPVEEMCKKIRAAARARNDPNFLLIARTDARSVAGLQESIQRALRYLDAGADAIFPEALESSEEFQIFAQAVRAPLLANMTEFGKTPYITVSQFAQMGYAMVIFPMTAFRMMMRAAEKTFETLKVAGTQRDLLAHMQTRQELYDLLNYPLYESLDKEIAQEEEL